MTRCSVCGNEQAGPMSHLCAGAAPSSNLASTNLPRQSEIDVAVRVLEWAKQRAFTEGDFQQAADLRGGQFRLERLLTVAPEGDPQ